MTLEETNAGNFDGPWPVSLDPDGVVHSQVPYTLWLPTRRFGVGQQRPDSSYKVRPIDDCTASGLNHTAPLSPSAWQG